MFTLFAMVAKMILWIGLGVNLDNEYVAELVDMFHSGEISASEFMFDLDMSGFDGYVVHQITPCIGVHVGTLAIITYQHVRWFHCFFWHLKIPGFQYHLIMIW